MSPFPRPDYGALKRYAFDRRPVALDLSDNTNQWGSHPAALAALRAATDDDLARYPSLYADELKAAAARRMGVDEAAVCTGCGSDDVLDAAWRACSGAGGVVRYASPTFSMVDVLSRMNGREPTPVAWSRALEDPASLLDGDPVLVYVCRPNNPTGTLAPLEWLESVLDLAAAGPGGGPLVIVDEAYADFAGESFAARAVERGRVLVVRTLSKAYGLAGLRVGYGIGAPEVVDEVEKARGPYKVGRAAGIAGAAALEDADGWTARTVAEAIEVRGRLVDELSRRGLGPLPSRTNFVLFPVAAGTAREKALALRERGVAVRPFPDCPDVGDALRVTVGPWPLMERFLEALDALLEASAGGGGA